MRYQGQQIAVLGAGRSGAAAAILLHTEGAAVTVLDSAPAETLPAFEKLHAQGIRMLCGLAAEEDTATYKMGVISPGVDPGQPLARNFAAKKIDTIGELELGWSFWSKPLIAITGTNGKTTTTELIEQMLNSCGQRTIACGNIGLPICEAVLQENDFPVLTVEVSSFQLETIRTFRPSVSVWLNFATDHLDRYPSLEDYRRAKLRIFENQTASDFAVVNARDALPPLAARKITFSAYRAEADFTFHEGTIFHSGEPVLPLANTKLRGLHNAENLMAALGVGLARRLTFREMLPSLCNFAPQPHRNEFVRQIRGVDFINDSKATNLDALENALLSQARGVVLIAGGKDKGFTFEALAPVVREKVRAAVLIGEMAESMARDWSQATACAIAPSLAAAVQQAHALALPGDAILFSPGTSSFDMFKSYADRGDQFRALVQALPASNP